MSTAVPTRLPSGMTNSYPKELLGLYSNSNPFNVHRIEDDFDWLGATGVKYTIVAATGSVAGAAGNGGRVLFTTGATAADFVQIQQPFASFLPTLGRRMFFATRIQVSELTTQAWAVGMMQKTATYGTITDGMMFVKATGTTNINLIHYVGSVATLTIPIPASAFTPIAAGDFDIGFLLDHKGNLKAFANTVANGGLFGYYPQSGGAPYREAIAGGIVPALTTAVLTPTLGTTTNAAAAVTMNADFLLAAGERA